MTGGSTTQFGGKDSFPKFWTIREMSTNDLKNMPLNSLNMY